MSQSDTAEGPTQDIKKIQLDCQSPVLVPQTFYHSFCLKKSLYLSISHKLSVFSLLLSSFFSPIFKNHFQDRMKNYSDPVPKTILSATLGESRTEKITLIERVVEREENFSLYRERQCFFVDKKHHNHKTSDPRLAGCTVMASCSSKPT